MVLLADFVGSFVFVCGFCYRLCLPRSPCCVTLHIWRCKGGWGLFVSEKSVHGSQWLVHVLLPLCQRCFPQAPQVGGGDSGEELEDKSQESASSDTEPEEPAGPAGINAVGHQRVVCACFLPDCLVCSGACVGQVMPGESSSQGLPRREWNNWKGRAASDSTLRLVAYVYAELQNMLDAAAPDQMLARGQGWSSIVSGDTSRGSRLEKK